MSLGYFPIKIRSRAKAKVNILEPMYLYMFFQVTDIIQSFSTARAIASKSVPLRVQDKITLATDVTTEIIIGINNLYTSKFTTVFFGNEKFDILLLHTFPHKGQLFGSACSILPWSSRKSSL